VNGRKILYLGSHKFILFVRSIAFFEHFGQRMSRTAKPKGIAKSQNNKIVPGPEPSGPGSRSIAMLANEIKLKVKNFQVIIEIHLLAI
jgi:hypothetical protein